MFVSINFLVNLNSIRKFSSALYITGNKASKTFAVLTPYIDFEQRIKNKQVLVENVKVRNLPIDVEEVVKKWQFFKNVDNQKNVLESTRLEIASSIKNLMPEEEKHSEDIAKLKLHSKIVKDDLKNLKEYFCEIEENVMLQILNLPNELHEKTPIEADTLVYMYLDRTAGKSKSHMELGKLSNQIEYISPLCCYLKSEAALFEFHVQNFFKNLLSKLKYTQFSNPDFVRSVVVEGCGVDFLDSSKVFTIEKHDADKSNNTTTNLHLVGASSLPSFMAYFTKHSVTTSYLPLKYFSIGRSYQPVNENCARNLFNVNQQSAVNIFVASLGEEDFLDKITEDVIVLYESLDYHFKLVFLPANKLENSESLRLSIQMFSNHLQTYVEVGNVSCYDSYLSKRLLFNYSDHKDRKYPKVIAGTLLNVQRLLGCVLETNSLINKDLLCSLLSKNV